MLCPACRTTSTKKERVTGKCPKCGRAFRFDPPNPLSDAEMEVIIAKVSEKGRYKFTNAQLVAETERFLVHRARTTIKSALAALTPDSAMPWILGTLSLLVGAAIFWLAGGAHPFLGAPFVLLGCLVFYYALTREDVEVTRARLESERPTSNGLAYGIVRAYLAAGPIEGLLPPPRIERAPTKNSREFDLTSFGFDRVVVVEGDDMVDMLVANRFHFEHNAAVVSFTGYPRHVAELVNAQLAKGHVKAPVFFLHSASAKGIQQLERWRISELARGAQLVNVGLSATQTAKLLPARPDPNAIVPFTADKNQEAALRLRSVDLSALRPLQAMTLLFNAIHSIAEPPLGDDGELLIVPMYGYASPVDTAYDFG